MMKVKIKNNMVEIYPYTIADFNRDFKNVSIPKGGFESLDLSQFDVYDVTVQSAPVYNPDTHRLQHSSEPMLIDGKWTLTKTVIELSTEQINDRLSKARTRKLEELSTLALEKEEADINVGGTIISAKREDQFRMTQALSLMGRKSGATKRFKAKNGWGEVNKATLEAMQDALEAQIDAVTTQHEAHETAILALTTAAEVEAYNIETGW